MVILISKDMYQYTEKDIKGIRIRFPHQMYDCQTNYMETIISALNKQNYNGTQYKTTNLLIESPTGTGKTLCLLISTLSWIIQNNLQQKHKVIYCSRTHTQLQQVQEQLEQLRKLNIDFNFATVLGSKDKLCIHPHISKSRGNELNQKCKQAKRNYKLSEAPRRPLRFDDENSDKDYCPLFGGIGDNDFGLNSIQTVQSLKDYGRDENVCPFYLSKRIKQKANILFMPYNYIFDEWLLQKYDDNLKDNIIILDEGHNVISSALDGKSKKLKLVQMQQIMRELNRTKEYYNEQEQQQQNIMQNNNDVNLFDNIDFRENDVNEQLLISMKLFGIFLTFVDKIFQKVKRFYEGKIQDSKDQTNPDKKSQKRIAQPLQMKKYFYDWFISENEVNADDINNGFERLKNCIKIIENITKNVKRNKNLNINYECFVTLKNFLRKVETLMKSMSFYDEQRNDFQKEYNHYSLIALEDVQGGQHYIELACHSAKFAFNELGSKNPKCMIITSGSLLPTDNWKYQTGLQFQPRQQSPKHCIIDSQLQLAIISQTLDNTTFKCVKKQRDDSILNFIQMLPFLIRNIPNGVILMLQSNHVLRDFRRLFQNSVQRTVIGQIIFYENEIIGGGDQQHFNNFKQMANQSKAILVCVSSGNFSEGINFSDKDCRAVIVVGVPFPDSSREKFKALKNYYERLNTTRQNLSENQRTDFQKLTGFSLQYQMSIQIAFQSVNQGIGRVIRHKQDYGMIILIDERFAQQINYQRLPGWIRGQNTEERRLLQDVHYKENGWSVRLSDRMNQFYLRNRQRMQRMDIDSD